LQTRDLYREKKFGSTLDKFKKT